MTPTTVYFDGLCPLCSREIEYYRRRSPNDGSIDYVDITGDSFDAAANGLDPQAVHRVMHVKVGGEVRTGVDAFIAIWEAVPGHRKWAKLARFRLVRPFMNVGYWAFAKVRPWLPRRKRDCAAGTCTR